jgi:HAD superfamily hydrolase (TIGR01509 family)
MTAIQYVFWDSDNTLVNTGLHHWRKHVEILKSLGITLDEKYQRRIYENNGAQNWEWLRAELGLTIPKDDYLDLIDRWYYDHIHEMHVRPGIWDALDMADHIGLPQAVVSNGRRRSVLAALTAKELAPRFEFILCNEDYEGRKPDPSPYLAAKTKMQQIKGLAIDPASCLVIEDDPLGVQSATAAGMPVIHRPPGDDDAEAFLIDFKKKISGL